MGFIWCVSAHSQTNPDIAKPEQRGTDKNPIAIKIVPAPDTDIKAAKDEEYRKTKAHEDAELTDSTVWLMRITGFLAFFTALLWLATYRLVKDAKDTSKKQLRAYLHIADVKITNVGVAVAPNTSVKLVNSGNTPARDVMCKVGIAVVSNASKLPKILEQLPQVGPTQIGPNGASLSPGAKFSMAIPADKFKELEEKSLTLFVHGRVDYTDIYNIPPWLTFRSSLDATHSKIAECHLRICDDGNLHDRN